MKRFLIIVSILIAVTAFADQRIMNGPASTTDGAIVIMDGTTGKQTATGPVMTTVGDIISGTASGWGVTAPGTNGYLIKYDTSQPGGIGNVDPSTLGSGTGLPDSTAKGQILSGDGAGDWELTTPGTNGYIPISDSSAAGGITYKPQLVRDVRDYGLVADAVEEPSGATTSISDTYVRVTITDNTFTSSDVGKTIIVQNAHADAGGKNLVGIITSIVSDTVCETDQTAHTAQTNVRAVWGTDDTAAIEASFADYSAFEFYDYAGLEIHFPTNSRMLCLSTIDILNKGNLKFNFNRSTIFFDDIILFKVDGQHAYMMGPKFVNGQLDGLQQRYVADAVSPTYSCAIYLDDVDNGGDGQDDRTGDTHITDMIIEHCKTAVYASADFYEVIIKDTICRAIDVPDSIGFNIEATDCIIETCTLFGFQTCIKLNGGTSVVRDSHLYVSTSHPDTNGSPTNYLIETNGMSAIQNNVLDFAAIAKVRLTRSYNSGSGVIITGNIFQEFNHATYVASPDILFDPSEADIGIYDILIAGNYFYTSFPASTDAAIEYSANVDLTNLNNYLVYGNTYRGGVRAPDTYGAINTGFFYGYNDFYQYGSTMNLQNGADTALVVGASATNTLADSTDKIFRMVIPSYDQDDTPNLASIILGKTTVDQNQVYFGGGTGLSNAATELKFYAAADNSTTEGAEVVRITSTKIETKNDADISIPSGTFISTNGADNAMMLGGNSSNTVTDSTDKVLRIAAPVYDMDDTPAASTILTVNNSSTSNALSIGGGTSSGNAVTSLKLYAASDNSTATGTEMINVTTSGLQIKNSGQLISYEGSGILASLGGAADDTLSDDTDKFMRIVVPVYDQSDTPTGSVLFTANNTATYNIITYGGGTSLGNAVSQHKFFTAADVSTTGGTERLRIDTDGGIFAYDLATSSGTALHLTAGEEIVLLSSSKRYKKNIDSLDIDTDKILLLDPKSFNWKSDNKRDFGVIAEEVEQIIPELVAYNKDGLVESVRYDLIGVLLIDVVKSMDFRIRMLELLGLFLSIGYIHSVFKRRK